MNIVASNEAGGELTVEEKKVLDELELFITDNFKVFFKVGLALVQIRDARLYRQTHATFEEYCRDRFDMAARTAYQYIAASDTMNRIKECAQIAHTPANESQVRPLTRLNPEVQVDAWKTAVESAPEGRITGRHVARVVSEMLGEEIRKKADDQKNDVRESAHLTDDMKDLCWALIEKVREARMNNFPKAVKEDLKKRLMGVLQLLED